MKLFSNIPCRFLAHPLFDHVIVFSIINDEDLLKILEMPILVVLDEAYTEFSGLESRLKWVKKHDNLIVLRTFSKRAGMVILACVFLFTDSYMFI